MTKNMDKFLSKALVEKGFISADQLDRLIDEAQKTKQDLSFILTREGLIDEGRVLDLLAKEFKLPVLDLKDFSVSKSVIEKIPLKFATYYKFMPLKIEDRVLTIAVSYPLDVKTQDEIRTHLGYEIKSVLSYEGDINDLLKIHYGLAADTINKIILKTPQRQVEELKTGAELEDIGKLSEEESVTKLVNQIIVEAYKRRATDIHLEPYRGKVRLRYRIDGILHNAPVPPEMTHFYSSILSRFKIMSNLDIIERRLPQDGRASVRVEGQVIDLRISSVPTPYTESLVIRLLPTTMLFDLERLGLSKKDVAIFEELVKKPHGIIFVTGPTGSGKSTTLYTCLSRLNTDTTKIVTIEDPIEYEMEGVTQMQVLPEIGLDFAMGLRSMLRHDPDVIMIGEVRDRETAEISIRVALTGHLVFSTLHTNDAASGIVRLIDIGLEPFLVATSVEAFIAQRLVRTICANCKVEDQSQSVEIKKVIARDLGLDDLAMVKVSKGEGCKKCNSTGFLGRTAIYEILLVDDVIKDMILRKVSSKEIKNMALKRGMHTLRQDGWRKVLDGLTTPEEVIRITETEDDVIETPGDLEEPVTEPSPLHPADQGAVAAEPCRRIYARLNTKVNISYRIVNVKGKVFKPKEVNEQYSTTEGISAGGLQFTSNEAISLGSIIELRIDLPDSGDSITCLAKVLRVELRDDEAALKKGFYISVCFLDISSAERVRLNRYVEEELN